MASSRSLAQLRVEAKKAADQADIAKEHARAVKAQLKQARKLSKASKRAAKLAKKKVEAAEAALLVRPRTPASATAAAKRAAAPKRPVAAKRAAAAKPPRRPSVKSVRSAAEVARSVIKRLESAPPKLPPTPVLKDDVDAAPPPTETPAV